MQTFQGAHQELFGSPAPVTTNTQLPEKYWNLPVSQLCELRGAGGCSRPSRRRDTASTAFC